MYDSIYREVMSLFKVMLTVGVIPYGAFMSFV